MGKPIGFFGSLRLGDRFMTVDREIVRMGQGVLPIFDGPTAELPADSPNWHRSFVAHFDKAESGSGPAGQWSLHAFFDDLEVFLTALASSRAALVWVGDEDRSSLVVTGFAAGANRTIEVADLSDLDLTVGDYVVFTGGAWGQVNLLGAGPPETLRVANLSAAVADGETCYRAWRVYPDCRPLGISPGGAAEESMDGWRMDISLKLDSKTAPVRSTAP